jgi:hypothetical protein
VCVFFFGWFAATTTFAPCFFLTVLYASLHGSLLSLDPGASRDQQRVARPSAKDSLSHRFFCFLSVVCIGAKGSDQGVGEPAE